MTLASTTGPIWWGHDSGRDVLSASPASPPLAYLHDVGSGVNLQISRVPRKPGIAKVLAASNKFAEHLKLVGAWCLLGGSVALAQKEGIQI
jgi:hypothetical protein